MQVKGIYNADHKTFLTPPPPKVGDNGNTDTGNGESTGNGENETTIVGYLKYLIALVVSVIAFCQWVGSSFFQKLQEGLDIA